MPCTVKSMHIPKICDKLLLIYIYILLYIYMTSFQQNTSHHFRNETDTIISDMFLRISTGRFNKLRILQCKKLFKLPNKVWKFNLQSVAQYILNIYEYISRVSDNDTRSE